MDRNILLHVRPRPEICTNKGRCILENVRAPEPPSHSTRNKELRTKSSFEKVERKMCVVEIKMARNKGSVGCGLLWPHVESDNMLWLVTCLENKSVIVSYSPRPRSQIPADILAHGGRAGVEWFLSSCTSFVPMYD